MMALLDLAWGFAQFKLGVPRILNSLVVIGPSVLCAFLTTHLARTSYGIEPAKWLASAARCFSPSCR
jgi:hypothetical protein